MIVYAQSGMVFNSEEKDRIEILQLDQFHMILVWFHFFLILGLYCSQYVIYSIHNMKLTIFLKIDYIIRLNNPCSKEKSESVRAQSLLMNFKQAIFWFTEFV